MGITSILMAVEDVRMDDTVSGVNTEEREVEQR